MTDAAPETYTVYPTSYNGYGPRRGGWTLHNNAAGGILVSIPQAWATKAMHLLNACPTLEEQNAECRRINAAVCAAADKKASGEREDAKAMFALHMGVIA